MPTPFLALNWKDGVTPQARRYVTCVPAAQGVTFGALESGNLGGDQAGARISRFLGCDTWIAAMSTSIYRSTDAGATYSVVHGPDADLGTTGAKAGPYLLYPGGTATLVILANADGTSTWRVWTSTDGITWAKTGAFIGLVNAVGTPPMQVALWRGSYYAFLNTGTSPMTLIWNTTNVSIVSGPATGNFANTAMCVFNDRLFAVGCTNGDSTGRTLYEFIGGAWTPVDTTFLVGSAMGFADAKFALFVDLTTNVMVGIVIGTAGTAGWRAFQWTASLTRTEITSAIGIQSVLGSASTTSRIAFMLDIQTPGGGATPTAFLYAAPNGTAGTPMTLCSWNGVASPIISIGSGGNVQHALPLGVRDNGGSVFWTSGQRHIERTLATPVVGGMRWTFRIYSPNPSVDTVSVRWIYGTASDEWPHSPYASLSNPSAGSLSGGNTITGLDAADNGATAFEVTWLAQADGFATGDFAKTTPDIFS